MAPQCLHYGDQISRRKPGIGEIDAREINGPLNEQITDAVAFASRNMQVAARKDPGRSNLHQYSEKALFEAVVNAVASLALLNAQSGSRSDH